MTKEISKYLEYATEMFQTYEKLCYRLDDKAKEDFEFNKNFYEYVIKLIRTEIILMKGEDNDQSASSR